MSKENLINELVTGGYLKNLAVIEAFQKIDRQDFVPKDLKEKAYLNEALPIGHEQTISQPLVVAFMLELLNLKPGEKVLEIGTGSGWNTALLAELGASVTSIERIPELNEFAKGNLKKYGFLEKGSVKLVVTDGSKGYVEDVPYDKIIAAASAQTLPAAWKEQLKIGGRIVAPVGQSVIVMDKIAKDKFETKEYFGYSFVPLKLSL